jgi:hypothetical protein
VPGGVIVVTLPDGLAVVVALDLDPVLVQREDTVRRFYRAVVEHQAREAEGRARLN